MSEVVRFHRGAVRWARVVPNIVSMSEVVRFHRGAVRWARVVPNLHLQINPLVGM